MVGGCRCLLLTLDQVRDCSSRFACSLVEHYHTFLEILENPSLACYIPHTVTIRLGLRSSFLPFLLISLAGYSSNGKYYFSSCEDKKRYCQFLDCPEELNFACSLCGQQFRDAAQWKKHNRTCDKSESASVGDEEDLKRKRSESQDELEGGLESLTGRRVKVWYAKKAKYYRGIVGKQTEFNKYYMNWDDGRCKKNEVVTLLDSDRTDDASNSERWNFI